MLGLGKTIIIEEEQETKVHNLELKFPPSHNRRLTQPLIKCKLSNKYLWLQILKSLTQTTNKLKFQQFNNQPRHLKLLTQIINKLKFQQFNNHPRHL